MGNKKVIIIGGGVAGLASYYAFKTHYVDVTIIERNKIGGEFLAGGLKYIHRTELIIRTFNRLNIPYSKFIVKGGILLRGEVMPYPSCFKKMSPEESMRVRADHYTKTRRCAPGEWSKTAMNDPDAESPYQALRCNFEEMVDEFASGANVVSASVVGMEPDKVLLDNGTSLHYDYLITTIPLWIMRKIAWFYVPHGVATRLAIMDVVPKQDPYAKWDYVYTPYTPCNAIHRISPHQDGYTIEANGAAAKTDFEGDLSFLFPEGYYIVKLALGLNGHLMLLEKQPEWPDNVVPIGRFAQWDPRATFDVVLQRAMEYAGRWIRDE